jgi:hypothetical protein
MWRVLAHRVALSEDRRACNSSGTGVRKILRAFPQGLKPFASGLKSPHRLRELSGARPHNGCRQS